MIQDVNQNRIYSHLKNVSPTVFLNVTTLHIYNSYLQELIITTIFYYNKKLSIIE